MVETKNMLIIGVPIGDPNGIGPEIATRATLDLLHRDYIPLLIGDFWLVEKALQILQVISQVPINLVTLPKDRGIEAVPGEINILDVSRTDRTKFAPGTAAADSGMASLDYTRTGVELALSKQIDGIACAPSNKEAMKLAGSKFSGQTEFISSLTGTRKASTVLVSDKFRVFQLTGHVSLRSACDLITQDRVLHGIRMARLALEDFGIDDPLIAVCGLNPHSGDGGLLGTEEQEHIIPAINKARAQGIKVDGPLPGDTVFLKVQGENHDGILAMYHDQANAVLKFISEPVSVTVGLPMVRTTVGHGTAYDIAWKGTANPSCMTAAIEVAAELAQSRKNKGVSK
jgi:4-hydroxythreonine-4-phosphate dehydrogenase